MGYEVRIYVGELTKQSHGDSGRWLQVWSMLDLCKPGYQSATYRLSIQDIGEPVYIFASDGNTEITKDCYAKRLKAIPLDDVLRAIEEDCANDLYRRFKVAADLLRSIKQHGPEGMSAFLYGH